MVMAKKTTPKKGTKGGGSKTAPRKGTKSTASQAKKPAPKQAPPKEKAPEKPPVEESQQAKHEKTSGEEKIKNVGDRLSEAADRGVEAIREVFGKVKDFSVDTAELTKLKVEVYRLKGDKERMLTVIGEKLWELRDSDKLTGIISIFADDFKKLEEINTEISKKEKAASKISL